MHGLTAALSALAILIAPVALASEADPHQLYESKCAGCHSPHAGDFVWLELDTGQEPLVGRNSGRSVAAMLERGHGRLTPAEATILLAHFQAIRTSGQLFRTKCRMCHDTASGLVRRALILRDGTLTGRYTGRDIAQFLTVHGRLTPSEAEQMLGVLERIATSIGRID
ncbi:hypothetical protein [Ruegeria sp. PrR005]|uniref:Cytochrome c domain-containing protein n=1 Tax=Ruegeria sp. PrR005 TaxID=2706882 RepID=A0A6B2NSU6_9RHOB|nr:hypothetical protein [Ruegeria sp. PrR005]NDW46488.1 hypothetical protein [Ruegeria sp. PrR005]